MTTSLKPELIASAARAPFDNVVANWPHILNALDLAEINSPLVQIGVAATIAVETGNFMPVKEIEVKKPDHPVYKMQQRYYPSGFYGRGFIQITWRDNYAAAGKALGIDLITNPDLALQPDVAAQITAWFFKTRGVGNTDKRRLFAACNDSDWNAVRRGINGPGYQAHTVSLRRYLGICDSLMEAINA